MTTQPPCTATPDLFWSTTPAHEEAAKAICHDCPLRPACAQQALDNDEQWGTWGGLTATERMRLKRGTGWWVDQHGNARQPCGTDAAYRAHIKYREVPCGQCAAAHDRETETVRRRVLRREHALPAGGSVTGYNTHRRLGEPPCAHCLAAVAARSAAQRATRRLAAAPDARSEQGSAAA